MYCGGVGVGFDVGVRMCSKSQPTNLYLSHSPALIPGATISDITTHGWGTKVTTLGLPPCIEASLEELEVFTQMTRFAAPGAKNLKGKPAP